MADGVSSILVAWYTTPSKVRIEGVVNRLYTTDTSRRMRAHVVNRGKHLEVSAAQAIHYLALRPQIVAGLSLWSSTSLSTYQSLPHCGFLARLP